MLTLKDYSVTANGTSILKDLNYIFESGKVHVIMGPNGSGKSTLALSLSGALQCNTSDTSRATLDNIELLELEPYKRAQAGLFVSFQSPPSLSGVTVFGMLRTALHGKREALDIKDSIASYATELSIPKELLSRSLNDGFSGGERKKMELLQMLVLDPSCIILDEIDTGVDIDALKTITKCIKRLNTKNRTLIIITHNVPFARNIQADTVTILKDGTLVSSGDTSLLDHIESEGYAHIKI